MEEKSNQTTILSENTLIAFPLLILIILGVIRVENISSKANANEKDIVALVQRESETLKELKEQSKALVRLETKFGTLPEELKTE